MNSTIRDYAKSFENSVMVRAWMDRQFRVQEFCARNPRYAQRTLECERRLRADIFVEGKPKHIHKLYKLQPVILEELERRERERKKWDKIYERREECHCSCHDDE